MTNEVQQEVEVTPPSFHTVDVGTNIRSRSSFGKTYYFIDPSRTRSAKGPAQLKGMVDWMLANNITTEEAALQGAVIGVRAIEDGFVETNKLTGQVIFAYYVRRMEKEFGLEHAKTVHAKTGRRMA